MTDPTILMILVQDGVVNGAIYALLALSLVLVFAVTRVVFIPQGEFVAFGALTYAALDAGTLPGSVWLLCWPRRGVLRRLAAGTARRTPARARRPRMLAFTVALPLAVLAARARRLAPPHPGVLVQAVLALLHRHADGAYLYRVAFRPLAQASVLVLLIAAVGVHLALVGLGLVFFGPEGSRATGFSEG